MKKNQDLIVFIIKLKERKYEVFLSTDAYFSILSKASDIPHLLSKIRMCDQLFNKYGCIHEPSTYKRENHHIKIILYTPLISTFIIFYGILPFDDITISDHRALYINL